MKLHEMMTREVVTVAMDESVEAIRAIFEKNHFHHLVVTREGKVAGVISDRDLLKHVSPFIGRPLMERAQDTNTLQRRAHQIMDRQPVVGHVDMTVEDAAILVLAENVTCLPIVDDQERLRGIVTWRDLLRRCKFCEIPDDQSGEIAA